LRRKKKHLQRVEEDEMDREHVTNFRTTDEEHSKLRALAEDEGESASTMLRRWIRQKYEARFGEAPPKAKGKR
jgi:hypothetical protein